VTKSFLQTENYLDPDVAYLLGMITGRGTFSEAGDDRRLVIDFPYASLMARGIDTRYDQRTHLQIAVGEIRERLQELIEANVETRIESDRCSFVMRFIRNNMTWRNLRLICEGWSTYRESLVPQRILEAPEDIKREFARGLSDVCGFVRASNQYYDGTHRLYVQIPAQNWALPIQVCRLFQVDLGVPAHCIQWNHPNTRIPNQLEQRLSPREHQVKIFAPGFLNVGFHVGYKQEILEELAASPDNSHHITPCNPNPEAHRIRTKPQHPEENSELISETIRGRHFDAYWQICTALGCRQQQPIDPAQARLFDREEGEIAEDTED